MRCEATKNLLDLSLDGVLSEETATSLARHLLRCPACATEMRTLETTRELLRQSVPAETASAEYHDRTLARLQAAFFANTRQSSLPDTGRQWTLPFAREDREAG